MTIISTTARAHGWGSDPYKWVSGLTRMERDLVKLGETVIVTQGPDGAGIPPSGGGNGTGERWRVARYIGGRWTHRMASDGEFAQCLSALGGHPCLASS